MSAVRSFSAECYLEDCPICMRDEYVAAADRAAAEAKGTRKSTEARKSEPVVWLTREVVRRTCVDWKGVQRS